MTDAAGPAHAPAGPRACAPGDYDNDGWTDLFITYYGRNVLYQQSRRRPLRGRDRRGRACRRRACAGAQAARFVDYDRDGRLDLFVANYLRFDLADGDRAGQGPNCLVEGHPGELRVRRACRPTPTCSTTIDGDGTFADVSGASGVAKVTGRYSMTAVAADLDRRRLARHLRGVRLHGRDPVSQQPGRHVHRRARVESGAAYSETATPQAGMGLAVGDYNARRPARPAQDALRRRHPGPVSQPRQGAVRGRRPPAPGLGGREPLRGMGRRTARSGQRRPAGPLLRHRQRLSRRSSGCCRNTRTAARGSSSGTRATARLRERHERERGDAAVAAFEPRRRLRRLSTTTATSTSSS